MATISETVSAPDAARTRGFYATKPEISALTGYDDLIRARAARRERFTASVRAIPSIADAAGHSVPVRIIEPQQRPIVGVLLHFPGGGFYMSSAVADDERNARRADATGLAVVSVDYRLAPENPWPVAPDDCASAADWLIACARDRFGTDKLLLGGFSAGATLAVVTLLRLRAGCTTGAFSGVLLEAGTYDLSPYTPSGPAVIDDYFVEAYAGHVPDRTLPDISPAYGDLHDLPPTLVVVGSDDVVLPDNLLMAARLSAAGNDVDLRIYPDVPHGFSNHPTPVGRKATEATDAWLITRLNR